jgi:hypothetical protein
MIDGEEGGTAPLSDQVADDTAAVVEEEAVTTTDDAGGGGDEDAAFEAEAREMGWVPEPEWKGDKKPAKFKSAREFVEAGQTILPIVKKRAEQAEAKLAEAEKKWEDRFAKMERMNEIALKKQREKMEGEFEARKREAVKLGDEEGYDAAVKAEKAALKELEDTGKAEAEKPQAGALSPAEMSSFAEWRTENPWFQSDDDLTSAMDLAFAKVTKTMTAATFDKKLEAAREIVSSIYPEKFGEKPTKRTGAVESGSRIPGGGQRGRLADKLPDEAKRAADKFIADGLFKDREEYAKTYFENEAA